MENKKSFYKRIILLVFVIAFILVGISIYFLRDAIIYSFQNEELFLWVSLVVAARIIILIIMSYILFRKWFQQEAIYLSDAFFLFSVFSSILIFGKFIDYFLYVAYSSSIFTPGFFLILTKVRYLMIPLVALPMLYLGLEVIMTLVRTHVKDVSKKKIKNYKLLIILVYMIFVSTLIIIFQDIKTLTTTIPIVYIGTMIGIIIMFFYMYKNKFLSQANGLIIGIGFIALILSSFPRSLLTSSAVETGASIGIIIAEILELIAFFIIFVGFITRPKYNK